MFSRLCLVAALAAALALTLTSYTIAFPQGGGPTWKCEQNAVHWCGPNWHSPHCNSQYDICMNPTVPDPEIRKCYPFVGDGPCLGFTCVGLCDQDQGRPCANWFPFYCPKTP